MALIYHLTTPAVWADAQVVGEVVAESLAVEGFIHCSRTAQLLAVANQFYAGVDGLLVLAIDEKAVASWLVYEGPVDRADPFAQDSFPHVYAPIPLSAVVAAAPLPTDADGQFVWPTAFPRT